MIRWMFNELKEDLKCLWFIISDDEYRDKAGKIVVDSIKYIFWNLPTILKTYWYWYLLIITALICGYAFAAVVYQNECNRIIWERGCFEVQLGVNEIGRKYNVANLTLILEDWK